MLTTTASTYIPPPPPVPQLLASAEDNWVSQDFFVEPTHSDALLHCLNNTGSQASYLDPYLNAEGQRISWNALHNFLAELITVTEERIGMQQHSQRVSRIALRCGVALGFEPIELSQLYWGGALHDIGKLALNQYMLAKSTPLSHSEWRQVQLHPEWGCKVIRQVLQSDPLARIAFTHHEHWNGRGYPNGLAGEDIPLHGRLMAIADTFDAIVSKRRYKKAVDKVTALAIIGSEAGRQLDPELTEFFLDSDVLFRSDLSTEQPDVG